MTPWLIGGAAVLAYLIFGSKTASAATSPGGGGLPSPLGGGGGGGSGGGGGGGGGGVSSSGDQGSILGPGGSSTPLGPAAGGSGVDAPPGILGDMPPGYGGGGFGSYGDGSGDMPAAGISGTAAGYLGIPTAYSVGQAAAGAGWPGWHMDAEMAVPSPGSPGWCFSRHPSILAVTGGRGGHVPEYPGCYEGEAPPGGLPIH